jgi:hypothetical protein
LAGTAPEWHSEKAVAIGDYVVASGPIFGSPKVVELPAKGLEGVVGAKFAVEPDPEKAAVARPQPRGGALGPSRRGHRDAAQRLAGAIDGRAEGGERRELQGPGSASMTGGPLGPTHRALFLTMSSTPTWRNKSPWVRRTTGSNARKGW